MGQVLQGTISNYNPQSRTAIVDLVGYGQIQVLNWLPAGAVPTVDFVNPLLDPSDYGTVLPAHSFSTSDTVKVSLDNGGTNYLLGLVTAAPTVSTPTATALLTPGKVDTGLVTLATDGSGRCILSNIGDRVLVRKFNITPHNLGPAYTVRVNDSKAALQASYGDGSPSLTAALVDNSGFFFETDDDTVHLVLLPAGTYDVRLIGERFSN